MQPCQNITFFLTELEHIFPKFLQNRERLQIDKAVSRKKNKAESITCIDFKPYYKATVIKTVWYWHKNGHTDQVHRKKNSLKKIPEIHPCLHGQLIY